MRRLLYTSSLCQYCHRQQYTHDLGAPFMLVSQLGLRSLSYLTNTMIELLQNIFKITLAVSLLLFLAADGIGPIVLGIGMIRSGEYHGFAFIILGVMFLSALGLIITNK